jgi:hypothetical protein
MDTVGTILTSREASALIIAEIEPRLSGSDLATIETVLYDMLKPSSIVMAGLDPAIHGSLLRKAWITGTSPVMTALDGTSGRSHRDAAAREVQ